MTGSEGSMIRVDLHNHSWASRDCLTNPEKLLAVALERGIHRIAITDHNRLAVALEMAELHPSRVIPGEEVKTAEGIDVIGLYLQDEIPEGTPAEEVCHQVKGQGGIVYLPHPYARGKGGSGRHAERLAPLVDVVEVFNGRLHPGSLNEPARRLAEEHGLPMGAGSDAHSIGEIAGSFAEVPDHPNDPAALLEALHAAIIHGSTAPWAVHLASTWAKVRKGLPGYGGSLVL